MGKPHGRGSRVWICRRRISLQPGSEPCPRPLRPIRRQRPSRKGPCPTRCAVIMRQSRAPGASSTWKRVPHLHARNGRGHGRVPGHPHHRAGGQTSGHSRTGPCHLLCRVLSIESVSRAGLCGRAARRPRSRCPERGRRHPSPAAPGGPLPPPAPPLTRSSACFWRSAASNRLTSLKPYQTAARIAARARILERENPNMAPF